MIQNKLICNRLVIPIFISAFLIGCGPKLPPKSLEKQTSVKGKVVFSNGTVLNSGLVRMIPADSVDKDGLTYEVSGIVRNQGEFHVGPGGNPINLDGTPTGVIPGKYKVIIEPAGEIPVPGTNAHQIPLAYRSAKTTPEELTVGSTDMDITITLK